MPLTKEQFDARRRDGYDGCQVAGTCTCEGPSDLITTILDLNIEGHLDQHGVNALMSIVLVDVPCECGEC
jgi:hypothetical protein